MKKYFSVTKLLVPVVCGFVLLSSTGCGESRPDPRANPDFNEEAYNDPDAAIRQMQGAEKPK